jgi:hypothetical protein
VVGEQSAQKPWKETEMNTQFSIETGVCTEHERLRAECERALETWNERRATFSQSRPAREAGDELLGLQVKYARAYTILQRHERNCSLCQLASRTEGRDSENSSDAFSGTTVFF